MTTDQEVWGSNPYETTKAAKFHDLAAFLCAIVYELHTKCSRSVVNIRLVLLRLRPAPTSEDYG